MATLTDFGKSVKVKLIELGKTQKWLSGEITKRTGLYCDDSYLHKHYTGAYTNPKVINAIKDILEMEG